MRSCVLRRGLRVRGVRCKERTDRGRDEGRERAGEGAGRMKREGARGCRDGGRSGGEGRGIGERGGGSLRGVRVEFVEFPGGRWINVSENIKE